MEYKYTLQDILLASPYNVGTNLQEKLSEKIFYKDFFIKSSLYDAVTEKIDLILSSNCQSEKNIYLCGFRGTGKSTYLRWYANKKIDAYNTIFFDFADYVFSRNNDIQDQLDDTHLKLFNHYFYKLSCNIYAELPHAFNELLSTVYKLRFTTTNSMSSDFFTRLSDYLDNKDTYKSTAFMNFVSECRYSDLLKLLLFLYFYHPTEFGTYFNIHVNNNLPLLLIFDNINDVELLEFSNSSFLQVIESSYRQVLTDIRKYKTQKQDDLVSNNTIHCIFCLRDANFSIINHQIVKIAISNKVEFVPLEEGTEIFLKRILMARENNLQLDPEKYEYLIFVLKDECTKRLLQPLFNYDMQKLAIFLWELTNQIDPIYLRGIKFLSKSRYIEYGSRGIGCYLIIRHLFTYDFLKENIFLNDGSEICKIPFGYVNPVRIVLTNILNKSKYSLGNSIPSTNGKPISYNNSVGLYIAFLSFNEIFENEIDLFFDILANLFLFHKDNLCHLVTISHKQVLSEYDFDHEKEILKKLAKNHSNDNTSINNSPSIDSTTYKRELNNIKVQLNPSGYIYIRDITRHYEFFSVRAHNNKPLFCSLGYEIKKDGIEFEFIRNIKKTFYLTKECLECLISFLNSGAVERFSSSVHCFRIYDEGDFLDEQKSSLHSVRIIDTHISYIDTFRLFILNNNEFLRSLGVTNVETVQRKINKDILDIIEQYISLLNKILDDTYYIQNLICVLNKNIAIIKKSDYADCNTLVYIG